MRFIDLFAGIGGFHLALSSQGHECVFASEIDRNAIETYYNNYNISSDNDIRKVIPSELPDYEILCAGFPCQSFSKAGKRDGFADETKGTLFFEIERLLSYRVEIGKPVKYILLENVANLLTHDKGLTIEIIYKHLENLGYNIPNKKLLISPHQIGVPQLRNRIFIVGVHNSFDQKLEISTDFKCVKNECDMNTILDDKVDKEYYLNELDTEIIKIWNEFYKGIKNKIIGFPIWFDELNDEPVDVDLKDWKKKIITSNRKLYKENKTFIDKWKKKHNNLEKFTPTKRKFEWQAGDSIDEIYEGITQFRPSGVRVKRPTEFPALVAMAHIPIVGKKPRHLTPREVARLQSFPNDFKICENTFQAYKQFGNSVNVDVIKYISKEFR